jgi:5'/3'-nucleotidase SurE
VAAAGAAERPSSAPLCGTGPLDILLTNDDGVDAPGIRALYARLREAGHRVLLVAPSTNASGSSSSFTWTPVRVTPDPADSNVFGVAGTPATAVLVGATALYPAGRRPDLVISGINDGANVGSLLVMSGTIGAALTGTTMLDPPVPGFAVNADRPRTPEAKAALPGGHIDQLALHLTRLIATTRGWFCDHGQVARARVVLNVNYPAIPVSELRGVRVARQAMSTDLRLRFEPSGDGTYVTRRSSEAASPSESDSDAALLEQGYVTVTPLDAALQDRDVPTTDLQRRLRK